MPDDDINVHDNTSCKWMEDPYHRKDWSAYISFLHQHPGEEERASIRYPMVAAHIEGEHGCLSCLTIRNNDLNGLADVDPDDWGIEEEPPADIAAELAEYD